MCSTFSILWPLAMTKEGKAEAARAETTAYRFWLMLIFLCQRLHTFVGENIRPPRHMFPKAPCPARCVPPPGTRGIRDTARPVPQDSALLCMPASNFTAYGCLLFFAKPVCTCLTMSGRMGAVNTAGKFACSLDPSSMLWMATKGLDAAIVTEYVQSKRTL